MQLFLVFLSTLIALVLTSLCFVFLSAREHLKKAKRITRLVRHVVLSERLDDHSKGRRLRRFFWLLLGLGLPILTFIFLVAVISLVQIQLLLHLDVTLIEVLAVSLLSIAMFVPLLFRRLR